MEQEWKQEERQTADLKNGILQFLYFKKTNLIFMEETNLEIQYNVSETQ